VLIGVHVPVHPHTFRIGSCVSSEVIMKTYLASICTRTAAPRILLYEWLLGRPEAGFTRSASARLPLRSHGVLHEQHFFELAAISRRVEFLLSDEQRRHCSSCCAQQVRVFTHLSRRVGMIEERWLLDFRFPPKIRYNRCPGFDHADLRIRCKKCGHQKSSC